MRLKKVFKKWYFALAFAVICGTCFHFMQQTAVMQKLEWLSDDFKFNLFPRPDLADTNIVMVVIDDNSLAYTRQKQFSYPWSREFYALTVDYLKQDNARAVLFDMLFYEPDLDRLETSAEESDGMFANSMAEANNVYLAMQFLPDSSLVPEDLPNVKVNANIEGINSESYGGGVFPIDIFRQTSKGLGAVTVAFDADGVMRRVPIFYQCRTKYFPNLPFCAFSQEKNFNSYRIEKNKLILADRQVPLEKDGKYKLFWYGRGGVDGPFKYVTIADVIESRIRQMRGKPSLFPAGFFQNKYVIIGATAAGLNDLKATPTDRLFPGMEIWATFLSNFLHGHFVKPLATGLNILLLCLLIAIVYYTTVNFKSRFLYPSLLVILATITCGNFFAWYYAHYTIPYSLHLFAFFFAYLVATTINYLAEGKAKRELKTVFSRYLHPKVIDNLTENPEQVNMGGEEIFATVLFTDIYNFTTFSEGQTPKQLVSYLNEYFENLTQFVLDNNGLLDKYTGDGIMAIFGVPVADEKHALNACRMALANQRFCRSFGESPEISQYFHLNTRIGIHSGLLVAGNIGSKKHMDYTAIGDTVNLSARLEGVNKAYATMTIISEATYILVKDAVVCRELDFIIVKGKKEPTRIYELLDENGTKTDYSWIAIYESGLNEYREGKFDVAETFFRQLPADKPAKVMLDRLQHLRKYPPLNWNGIFELKEK